MRRILFVDDEPRILDGLRRMLRSARPDWDTRFAVGGAAALVELERWEADAVITDMRMPGMDGASLLEHVARRWPGMIRLVLSGQTDDAAAARAIPVAHQFVMKPCSGPVLCASIDRACSLRDLLDSPILRDTVGTIDTLPPAPGIYAALGFALRAPASSVDDIAEVIQRDGALTAKVLQLVNSAFFGIPREISSINQAVALLGAGRIRSLALSHEIFGGRAYASPGLSLEEEQDHAVRVASLAFHLVDAGPMAEAALTAGLLHDVGKLILAERRSGDFLSDLERSRRERCPMHQVEQAARGVTHAEVGAYLLGLWGLPHPVVEAVAYHHEPQKLPVEGRRVAAAVQVADALVRAASGGYAPALVPEAVAVLGGEDQLEDWRELAGRALQ